MPWPMKAVINKCVPLYWASLYYCTFVGEKKTSNVTSQTMADVEPFLFKSICFGSLYFDLLVNVLCLEIPLNLLSRHVQMYRALFSIHSLPSSVALFEVSGRREPSQVSKSALSYMFHELYPGAPQPPLGKTIHLHHRWWLQLCAACPWEQVYSEV
jgi:hypothetical protein